jgi:hypothetical protein
MKLTAKRLDRDGRYETLIARDDGVNFLVKGVGHNFAIPHDIAHLVVEKALRIRNGFWGSIADGAVFPSMIYTGGRRKPKAAERSKELLKANARQLNEAEVLVRIFNDTIEQGHQEGSAAIDCRLKERMAPPGQRPREISKTDISEVFAAYRTMLSKWKYLPVNGALDLHWKH